MSQQRPLTSLGNRQQGNQYNSVNSNNKRPLTSVQQQKNFSNTLKTPQSANPNQNSQYFMPRTSKSHKKSGSLQDLQNKLSINQYSQHIGDEGERLDSEQKQLQDLKYDINKKRPTQQRIDKEILYEEAVNLNNYLAKLQQEQQNLDEKLVQVEEDKYKYQKQIQDVEAYIIKTKGPKIKGQQSQLVINLKKQLELLKEEIAEVDDNITSLKKNNLFTKQMEFEIQLFNFKEQSENFRKNLIEIRKENKKLEIELEKEKKKKNPNYKMQIQKKQKITEADILLQEVFEKRAKEKILQQQNDVLQSKQATEERKIQQNMVKLNQLKEEIQRKDNLYQQMLENRDQLLEMERKKKEQQEKEQKKLKRKTNQSTENSFMIPRKQEQTQNDIKKQMIEEKKKIIQDQQRQIEEIDGYLTKKVQIETKQRNVMTNKVQHLRSVIKNLEDKLDKIDTVLEDELQHLPIEHMPKFGKGQYTEVFVITNDILHQQELEKLKKVPKVTLQDIEYIVKELTYKLRIKHIPLEKALQRIIPDKISLRGHGTVNDMQTILQKSPFSILDADDALLVARYLVEDNQQDMVDMDLFRVQDQEVIRSVFKNLLGKYVIYTEDQEFQLWEDIAHIIQKYGVGLQQQALLYDGYEETGMLTPKDIDHCFSNVIEIPFQKLDYIYLRLYEHGNSFKLMDFKKILDIFKMGNWFDRTQRRKMSKVLQLEDQKKRQLIERGFEDDEDETQNNYYYQQPVKKQSKTSIEYNSHNTSHNTSEQLETRQDKFFKSPVKKKK